jgi:hypothetical protein
MKKLLLLVIASIVLVFASIFFALTSSVKSDLPSTALPPARLYKRACDLFTLDDAKRMVDANIQVVKSGQSNTIIDGTADTTCAYGIPANGAYPLSVIVRVQDSSEVVAQKNYRVAQGKFPILVQNLGDSAHWQTDTAQLHVLKGQYWLVISAGSGEPKLRNYDLPVRIAEHVLTGL